MRPSRVTLTFVRSRWRVSRSAASTERVGRVQLGGDLVFDDRLLEAIEGGETTGRVGVVLGGPQLDAVERGAGVDVGRIRAHDLGVLRDRAVVVQGLFGLPARAHRAWPWHSPSSRTASSSAAASRPVNGPMSRR